jgi:hypothetical protein
VHYLASAGREDNGASALHVEISGNCIIGGVEMIDKSIKQKAEEWESWALYTLSHELQLAALDSNQSRSCLDQCVNVMSSNHVIYEIVCV